MKEPSGQMVDSSVPLASIRPALQEFIRARGPRDLQTDRISEEELNRYRTDYVAHVLREEIGEITTLERQVIDSMRERELLSENIDAEFARKLSPGEWCADKLAQFGGSWSFIIIFGTVIVSWIGTNAFLLRDRSFDPYPFILLNLVLSCLAAIQAPIIMMSQNRVEERDRLRAEHVIRSTSRRSWRSGTCMRRWITC